MGVCLQVCYESGGGGTGWVSVYRSAMRVGGGGTGWVSVYRSAMAVEVGGTGWVSVYRSAMTVGVEELVGCLSTGLL